MRIGLSMIVKDEAAGIVRTLESCRDLVAVWDIVDTGSTDGTRVLIEQTMADIPGQLYQLPFVDFSSTRNDALRLARGDWVLLVSGDEVVTADRRALQDFLQHSENAEHDARVRHGDLEFGQVRLVRPGAEYEGLCHERVVPRDLGCCAPLRVQAKPSWSLAKLKRDLAWLTGGCTERDLFYLAQTLQCLGRLEDAAFHYAARGAWRSGDSDEWWLALLRAGELGDARCAGQAAVERSWRPEAWLQLARWARGEGDLSYAAHCLATAEQCPPVRDRGPTDWRVRKKIAAERLALAHARLGSERK